MMRFIVLNALSFKGCHPLSWKCSYMVKGGAPCELEKFVAFLCVASQTSLGFDRPR